MLKVERFVTASPAQMKMIIDGMRNPHDSWGKSDSYITHVDNSITANTADFAFCLGENDEKLMRDLAAGGSVHAKYRRMMPVWVDIVAPLYWWKEFETYRTGIAPNPTDIEMNSCSTMHRIHAKEFTLEDFSCEKLIPESSLKYIEALIHELNGWRTRYLATNDKEDWWQMIQLLPSSYNQRRTIFTNYEALSAMYYWRHEHKLDEWRTLCAWMEKLPYGYLITGEK